MENFCSGQTCKNSIKKVILPLCWVSCDGITQKPLQSSSFPPQLRPDLWQPLALRGRNIRNTRKLNIGKQDQNHHLVHTLEEVCRCLL